MTDFAPLSTSVEFAQVHRVQFGETDLAGVVHFSNYFRWMEEVEHGFFRSVGLRAAMKHGDADIVWPRVSASCEYLGPVRFDEEVELRLRVTKVGQTSLRYEVEFIVGQRRVALGKITTVCCRLANGEMASVAIPPSIREKLCAGA